MKKTLAITNFFSAKARYITLASLVGLSGCTTNEVLSAKPPSINDLPPETSSCSQRQMQTSFQSYFSFLFNQQKNVGIADMDHGQMHFLYEKINNEYCAIFAGNNVTDLVLEGPHAQFQSLIDQFFDNNIEAPTVQHSLYSFYSEHMCFLKPEETQAWLNEVMILLEKTKKDGVRIHLIDPSLELIENADQRKKRTKYCHYFGRSDGDPSQLSDFEQTEIRNDHKKYMQKRYDQDPIILERAKKALIGSGNTLFIYGAGHFSDVPDSLSKIAVSAALIPSFTEYSELLEDGDFDDMSDYALPYYEEMSDIYSTPYGRDRGYSEFIPQ